MNEEIESFLGMKGMMMVMGGVAGGGKGKQ